MHPKKAKSHQLQVTRMNSNQLSKLELVVVMNYKFTDWWYIATVCQNKKELLQFLDFLYSCETDL